MRLDARREPIPHSLGDDLGAVCERARDHVLRAPSAAARPVDVARRHDDFAAASLWVYWAYDRAAAGFQFQEEFALVPSLGISYLLAIDGMSALMVLLTSIIIFAGVFASWTVKEREPGVLRAAADPRHRRLRRLRLPRPLRLLPLLRDRGAADVSAHRHLGIFRRSAAAGHLRLGDGPDRRRHERVRGDEADPLSAVRVGVHPRRDPRALCGGGSQSFSFLAFEELAFDPAVQSWVFLAFYIGFGILAGIWPLHTWSPDGHASAPTAVSMLHAGVLMKLGAYGVVRLGMGLLPDATVDWAWLVGAIACINIVYGALSAMAQTDLKYVIAYSSVSHMGVVMLGAATLTVTGLNGSVFQMFAHGIMTGLFFALVGLVYEKAHSREIFKMGGFGAMMPGIATAFTIGGLSSLGLPATAGFVAEFLTFLGAWSSRIAGGFSLASSVPS